VARVIPFERGSRLEEVLRRRAFLGPELYVFGHAKTGEYANETARHRREFLLHELFHRVQPQLGLSAPAQANGSSSRRSRRARTLASLLVPSLPPASQQPLPNCSRCIDSGTSKSSV
jgi:hypothetical protein